MVAGPGAEMSVLRIGARFHTHYEVLSCIKAGGMGAVYEVLDHRTRRRRALKLMLQSIVSDPELRARFSREATVTSDIHSEHIVETFDAGVDPATGAPFLVMELLMGDDLGAVLEKRGSLPPSEVVTLLHQAALALARTHAAGVVHRDLKPENLFVTFRDDGSPRLKVLDFGIAKVVAQSSAAKGTRSLGTPLYMAPEQIKGDAGIGPRADLYALGHIAYTLLAGRPTGSGRRAPRRASIRSSARSSTARSTRRAVAPRPDRSRCRPPSTRGSRARRRRSHRSGSSPRRPCSRASPRRWASPCPPCGSAGPTACCRPRAPAMASKPTLDSSEPSPAGILGGVTDVPISSTLPVLPARRRPPLVAIVGGLAVVGAMTAGLAIQLVGLRGSHDAAKTAAHGAPSTTTSVTIPAPSHPGTVADPPITATAPGPSSSQTAAPPHVASSPKALTSATARTPGSHAAVAPSAAPSQSATSSPSAAQKVNCNPPYFFDDKGDKIFKRECVK